MNVFNTESTKDFKRRIAALMRGTLEEPITGAKPAHPSLVRKPSYPIETK